MTSWFSKTEAKPLSEVVAQNTLAFRKAREAKIQIFSEKVYQKILDKLTYHSTHFTSAVLEVNVTDMFSDAGDKLFQEFAGGEKNTEPLTNDEFNKICSLVNEKLTKEKFVSQVSTETVNIKQMHIIHVNWNDALVEKKTEKPTEPQVEKQVEKQTEKTNTQ